MGVRVRAPLTPDQRLKMRARRRAQLARALESYVRLVGLLGGCCVTCETELELLIHHVQPKTWKSKHLRLDARVKRYWQEFEAGVALEVMCRSCHSKHHNGDARYVVHKV